MEVVTTGRHKCPWCGAAGRAWGTARDWNRGLGDASFHYARCGSCRTIFLVDPPEELHAYYDGVEYLRPLEPGPDLEADLTIKRWYVEQVGRIVPRGRLLEVGPGRGALLVAARQAGFEVAAIEMDDTASRNLRDGLGVPTTCSSEPERVLGGEARWDVIAFVHSLEHLPRPREAFDAAAASLRPGGALLVATPNPSGLQARLARARWAHVDAPRHLQLLPLEALADAAATRGLALVVETCADPAGRTCDDFGWRRTFANLARSPRGKWWMTQAGRALGLALRPLERTGRRGASYTIIWRFKGGAGPGASSAVER